jgi:hypothetical protein
MCLKGGTGEIPERTMTKGEFPPQTKPFMTSSRVREGTFFFPSNQRLCHRRELHNRQKKNFIVTCHFHDCHKGKAKSTEEANNFFLSFQALEEQINGEENEKEEY